MIGTKVEYTIYDEADGADLMFARWDILDTIQLRIDSMQMANKPFDYMGLHIEDRFGFVRVGRIRW